MPVPDRRSEVFAALLAHWELERLHVIAHDFGGAVSLRAHLVHGAGYRSLMLVDVVAIPPRGSPFFRFAQDPDALPELPASIHEAIVRTYIQGAAHRELTDAELESLLAPWRGPEGHPAFYRQIARYDEAFPRDNEQRVDQITAPVRVLWGDQNAWIPVKTGRRLAGLIPDASLGLVEGSGHLLQYDAPVALADEIRAWLTHPTKSNE